MKQVARLTTFLIALGAALARLHQPAAAETLSISDTGSGSSTHWPIYIATAEGFFKSKGLSVEYIPTDSSAASTQALAAGSVDLASSGMADALRAIDKGANASLFLVECGPSPYEIMAKPAIKSLRDLKGKTIMIGGLRDITHIYLDQALSPVGLKSGDYDLVFAGASSARFAALEAGSVDAVIVTPPFNFQAKADGFSDLGAVSTDAFPFSGYVASPAWAARHKAEIEGFIAGYRQGAAWFYDPANKAKAVDILLKASPGTRRQDAEKTYDFYAGLHLFDRDGAVPKAGIANLLKILKGQGDIDGSVDPARFVDAAFSAQ